MRFSARTASPGHIDTDRLHQVQMTAWSNAILLIVNENHLRQVLAEYHQHYNEHRAHRKQVLGGLTHEYQIAA